MGSKNGPKRRAVKRIIEQSTDPEAIRFAYASVTVKRLLAKKLVKIKGNRNVSAKTLVVAQQRAH